ncbi:MAG: tetratricopeptide repeat protein [Desulfobacteraceae bacterium]
MPHSALIKAVEENTTYHGLLIALIMELKKNGHTKSVVSQCRCVLERDPGNIEIRRLLAETYLDLDLPARAGDELEHAARRLDDLAEIYLDLAGVYERQGRKAEASRALEIFLAHHPENARALELSKRLSSGEIPGPSVDEHSYVDLPEIATPTLAELYAKQGQIPAAIDTYRKILARDPGDQRAAARIQELEAMETTVEGEVRRTEKLVSILEQWLSRIQEART